MVDENKHLMFFDAGGSTFATEAAKIKSVGDFDWVPASNIDLDEIDESSSRVTTVASLLSLPDGPGSRTLVVNTSSGVVGLVVDSITRDKITTRPISPVPKLLSMWITPMVVSGFSVIGKDEKIVNVLDLQLLAELATKRTPELQKQEKPSR